MLSYFLYLASLRSFGYKSSRTTDSDLVDAAAESFATNYIHSYRAEAPSVLFLLRTVIRILQNFLVKNVVLSISFAHWDFIIFLDFLILATLESFHYCC